MYLYEDGNEPEWMRLRLKVGRSMTFNQLRTGGIAMAISGGMVVIIALLAMLDMAVFDGQLHFSTWGFGGQMSLPACVCFMLSGSSWILMASLLKSLVERR